MFTNSEMENKKICFSTNYSLGTKNGKGTGEIEFSTISQDAVYVSWNVIDEEKNIIAGKSSKYFIKQLSKVEVIKKITDVISKYRIGRKRIFSNFVIS
jgi:hypothetical protein